MNATKGSFYYGKPINGHEQDPRLDAGDDAVPYLGHCLLSVADGTGARSGGPQLHINRQLLRADTSFDAALRGCLGKHPEDYLQQYEENFRYLLTVGEDYDRILPRKSGYFGSRLTSILMRRLVEDKRFDEEEALADLMQGLHRASPEERELHLEDLGGKLARKLREKLDQAAQNCGMTWDFNNDNNLSLMGTTYSGLVYLEAEDCVHVISIQAGDSLCLAMTAQPNANGHPMLTLQQLLPAQERESDGGLSNCIGVNHDFHFACAYHCLPKPCVLLAVSDGCFDAFSSMRWFEHFLMTHLADEKHQVLADALNSMHAYFATGASLDDASTLVAATFGFDVFARLRRMASMRLEDMVQRYGMKAEDASLALTQDEESLLEENRVQRSLAQRELMAQYADACWQGSGWLREKFLRRLDEPDQKAAVDAAMAKESVRSGQARTELRAQQAELRSLVDAYWLTLRPRGSQQRSGFSMGNSADALADDLAGKIRSRDRLSQDILRGREDQRRQAQQLAALAEAYSLPEGGDARAMEQYHFEHTKQLEQQLQRLEDASGQLVTAQYQLAPLKTDIDRMSRQLLAREEAAVTEMCEALAENRPPRAFYSLDADAQAAFQDVLKRIVALRRELDDLTATVLPRIREGCARQLFLKRPMMPCLECINEHGDTLPAELYGKLRAALDDIEARFPSTTERSRHEADCDAAHERELTRIMVRKV